MARKQTRKRDNSTKAGLIAFGVTLLAYALIFNLHKPLDFIIGGGLSALAAWVVKTMATPMKGLDKNAKAKEALDVTIIDDEYARGVVEKGVDMLDALKTERDAINEYVFTRRINETRENLDKVLRNIIEAPDKAHRIRRMNSYYLPTAIKLLQSYRSAKQQGTSFMTMSQTREDVLDTLDKLNEALATILDAMLKDDLEDMDIEIDVFERMLKSDGLQTDEVTQSLRQSAHEAAREIPMSQAPSVKPTVPQAAPAQAPAPQPAAAKETAPVSDAPAATVPVLNVPATASARQLNEGTPVLHVPQAPAAPDYSPDLKTETKA